MLNGTETLEAQPGPVSAALLCAANALGGSLADAPPLARSAASFARAAAEWAKTAPAGLQPDHLAFALRVLASKGREVYALLLGALADPQPWDGAETLRGGACRLWFHFIAAVGDDINAIPQVVPFQAEGQRGLGVLMPGGILQPLAIEQVQALEHRRANLMAGREGLLTDLGVLVEGL